MNPVLNYRKSFVLLCSLFLLLIAIATFASIDGSSGNGLLRFFGRFHILILHFPITILFLIPIFELITRNKNYIHLNQHIIILWWLGSFFTFCTVTLGILLASNEGFTFDDINAHLTGGLSVALLAFAGTIFKTYDVERKETFQSKIYKFIYPTTLSLLIIMIMLTAHAGGNLVHGETYLTRYAPSIIKDVLGVEEKTMNIDNIKDEHYLTKTRPLLETYCFDCHGSDVQKAGVRLDVLDPDFANGHDAPNWHAALDMINSGEMPPKKKKQPSDEERRIIVDWLNKGITIAKQSKKDDNKQVIRRLTKQQYTNTLKDLLDIDVNFGEALPDDPLSEMGFSNNGELLTSSALHLEYFQNIARDALTKAIVVGEKPKVHHYRMHFGKTIGEKHSYTMSEGYLDSALSPKNFYVEDLTKKEQSNLNLDLDKEKFFSVSLRGSTTDRFNLEEDGLTLLSALPHKEVVEAGKFGPWNTPSPNLSMQIKDQFPAEGSFAIRINASKGHSYNRAINSMKPYYSPTPISVLDDNNKVAQANLNTTVVYAQKAFKKTGLKVHDTFSSLLTSIKNTTQVELGFRVKLPDSLGTFYKIELIHGASTTNTVKEARLRLSKNVAFDIELPSGKSINTNGSPVVSTIGVAYLSNNNHKLILSGSDNFPDIGGIILTKIKPDSLAARSLTLNYTGDMGNENLTPSIMPYIGTRTDDGVDYKSLPTSQVVSESTNDSVTYDFTGRLENYPIPPLNTKGDHITSGSLKIGLWNNQLVKNAKDEASLVKVNYIEFEAPYFTEWPTQAHKNIFIESSTNKNNEAYVREIIENFASKAYRRPISSDEVDLYINLWNSTKSDFETFEEGVKETLVAVLSSPNFLYLSVTDHNVSDSLPKTAKVKTSGITSYANASTSTSTQANTEYSLASKLSYFLWDSPPDAELLNLAKQGVLSNNLENQIERMVNNPNVERFINVFTNEWLRLDRHKNQQVDIQKFPDYTRFVKQDMAKETLSFIKHIIQNNLSVLNIVDSSFMMLNQNLAEFYGIDGVTDTEFTPIQTTKVNARGGLMMQGAFLTGHADGLHSHPVKRAVWLKEKILGDSPPPPPPNVPELDPDTPGFDKLTLKQQLELHRDKESCRDCHAKIDPYGIIFENYDAVGRYRADYKGTPIDAMSVLPDGTTINNLTDIKRYLMKDKKDQVTVALIKHLFSYALGKEVSFHDEDEIQRILELVQQNQYKMQTLLTAIVSSESFKQSNINQKTL